MERDDSFLIEEVESRNGVHEQDAPPPTLLDIVIGTAAEHRRALLRVLLIALAICTAAAFLLPVRYESTTRIMPPEGPNPAALLAAVTGKVPSAVSEMASGMLGTKATGPLYMGLLESRTVLDHQIDRFDLMRVYWRKKRYKVRQKLVSRTDLKEDRKSGVISISVSDSDKGRARALADGYVHELDELLASVSTSSARRERIFLEQRLNEARSDLENAEVEFGHFAAKNSTFDLKEQTRAIVSAGAELQGQIIAAQSELEGLQQIYTSDNVRVRSVKARIASLKREMAKMGGTGQETDVSLAPGDLSPPVRQLPIVGVQWADLYRKTKIQETIYELLRQQYELARIQEAKEIPTVRVIDPADYPERRSWPPRTLIIILGPLFAVACALTWFKLKQDWGKLPADNPKRVRTKKFVSIFRPPEKKAA